MCISMVDARQTAAPADEETGFLNCCRCQHSMLAAKIWLKLSLVWWLDDLIHNKISNSSLWTLKFKRHSINWWVMWVCVAFCKAKNGFDNLFSGISTLTQHIGCSVTRLNTFILHGLIFHLPKMAKKPIHFQKPFTICLDISLLKPRLFGLLFKLLGSWA